jgi:hypothetical protein
MTVMIDKHEDERQILADAARAAFREIVKGFSIERLKRLRGSITWSEMVASIEIHFDVEILESTSESIHIAVEAFCACKYDDLTHITPPHCVLYDDILRYD